ncbi:hypothetical protein JCM12298_07450 [Desulfothermus naphthae]
MEFKKTLNLLNDVFTDIVVVMTQIVNLADEQIKNIESSSKFIDDNVEKFLNDIENNIKEIGGVLTKKLVKIDIEQLKLDIEDSTKTFMDITGDLEILSLNTICQTKNLGKKKATISYISHEIKKDSDKANVILTKIKESFHNIYESVKNIINFFDSLKNIQMRDKEIDLESIGKLQISSNVAKIMEYSQFHDIFRQQLEKIDAIYSNIDWNNDGLFEKGQKLKFYESVIPLLKEMEMDISNILEEILEAIKEYLYDVNTDIQNMFSKVGLVDYFYRIMDKKRGQLLDYLDELKIKIDTLQEGTENISKEINELLRFRKHFFNLTIATKIEVNRLGISSLQNLVTSMNDTYNNLLALIKKMLDTVNVWKEISDDLLVTIQESYDTIFRGQNKSIDIGLNKMRDVNDSVENELNTIKKLLVEKDYINRVKEYKKRIMKSFEEMISSFEMGYEKIRANLNENDMILDDFRAGYESIDVEKIKAGEEELSTIELF